MSYWRSLPLKRKLIILAVCLVFFFFLFRSDYAQQKSYAVMYDAYEQMEDGNYETAAEEFQQYLDNHSSKIYWKIQKVISQNDQSTYESVKAALEECQNQYLFIPFFQLKNKSKPVLRIIHGILPGLI